MVDGSGQLSMSNANVALESHIRYSPRENGIEEGGALNITIGYDNSSKSSNRNIKDPWSLSS